MSTLRLYIAHSIEGADLPKEAKEIGVDSVHIIVDSFGIDDARELKISASQSGVQENVRSFVIVARTFTMEAQNALLKLFEELPETAAFHIVISHESLLIPTLRSRFVNVETSYTADTSVSQAFLAQSYNDRLETIATKARKKEYQWMDEVVRGLQETQAPKAKQSIYLVDQYLKNRGASRKMLMEELALALPVT